MKHNPAMLLELARSADWAAGVVFVNGHGGNHSAVTRAVTRLTAEREIPSPMSAWLTRVMSRVETPWT